MKSPSSRRLSTALIGPLLVVSTCGVAAASASSDPAGPPSPPPWHLKVSWTNTAPPISIGAPKCNAAGQCLYPWTEVGESHGDLEGTYIASGVATVNVTGQLAVSRIDTFTGSVKGCGTGSMVVRATEDLGPSPKPSRWQVVDDFGTGDLVGIRGDGQGTGAQTATGLTSTLTGTLTCAKSDGPAT
jgi:hypothetical protein